MAKTFNETVELLDTDSKLRIRLDPVAKSITVLDGAGSPIVSLDGLGAIRAGDAANPGVLMLSNGGSPSLIFDSGPSGAPARAQVGGPGRAGHLVVTDSKGDVQGTLQGWDGALTASGAISAAKEVTTEVAYQLIDSSGSKLVQVDGKAPGGGGQLALRDGRGVELCRLYAGSGGGQLLLTDGRNQNPFLDGGLAIIRLRSGALQVTDRKGVQTGRLSSAFLDLGGDGASGLIKIHDGPNSPNAEITSSALTFENGNGDSMIRLLSLDASIFVGGKSRGGLVSVVGSSGVENIRIDGRAGTLVLKSTSGANVCVMENDGTVDIGAPKDRGRLVLRNSAGDSTVELDGGRRRVTIGPRFGRSGGGLLDITDKSGATLIQANGDASELALRDGSRNDTVVLNGLTREIALTNSTGKRTITIDGESGDIELHNADCAEAFHTESPEFLEPGSVAVAQGGSNAQACEKGYDKRVLGVVSGAGSLKPGIVLGKGHIPGAKEVPIALAGRVFCRVDTANGPIDVGDLLTTSPTRGHAMKATDSTKSFGSVLGKALGTLDDGRGLIPILVALQ